MTFIGFVSFMVDFMSFIFAVLLLPIGTIVFWLSYVDPDLENVEEDDDSLVKKVTRKEQYHE